jgi:hypothetical protein
MKRADPARDGIIVEMAIEGYRFRDVAEKVGMTRLGVRHAVTKRLAATIAAHPDYIAIMKYCGRCDKLLATTAFSFDCSRTDGLNWRCRACQRDYDLSRSNLPERLKRFREHLRDRDAQ